MMSASVWCICWVLAAGIPARSVWYRSKVRGQPAGIASWWQAWAGWVAHYSWKKKKKQSQFQESWSQKYLQNWYAFCLSTTGQRHRNSLTTGTRKGMCLNVCPCACTDLAEHRTTRIRTNKGPCSVIPIKCLLGTGEGNPEIDLISEASATLTFTAQITYKQPYIEDSWHWERTEWAKSKLMWSCHHPEHQMKRERGQKSNW